MSLKLPRHWDFSTFKAETVRIGESDQPWCVHGVAFVVIRSRPAPWTVLIDVHAEEVQLKRSRIGQTVTMAVV